MKYYVQRWLCYSDGRDQYEGYAFYRVASAEKYNRSPWCIGEADTYAEAQKLCKQANKSWREERLKVKAVPK